jgi:hypothetical protein
MLRTPLLQVPVADEEAAYLRIYDTAIELEPQTGACPPPPVLAIDFRAVARVRLRAGPHLTALLIEDTCGRAIHVLLGATDARRVAALLREYIAPPALARALAGEE